MAIKVRNKKRLAQAAKWYDERRDLHERLAAKLKNFLEELLSANTIQFDHVEVRVKTRSGYLAKADKRTGARPKYRDPTREIKDVVGLRVVTHLDSVRDEVGALLERELQVDQKHSLDKDEALGTDRVGYRSLHYVAEFGGARTTLPEYAAFRGVPFEIQVRSLLQHAWAEMEHDRRFKYRGELRDEIKRRFSLLAGQLETADRELNALAKEIDEQAAHTVAAATSTEAAEPLSVLNAVEYLRGVLAKQLAAGIVEPGIGGDGGRELFQELHRFGIQTLGMLADLFPADAATPFPEAVDEEATFIGLLRNAMILKDARRYFTKAWKEGGWSTISRADFDFYRRKGVDLQALLHERGITVDEDEDGYAEVPLSEKSECSFCGRWVPDNQLNAIGMGGDAPLACPSCVREIDEEAKAEREHE